MNSERNRNIRKTHQRAFRQCMNKKLMKLSFVGFLVLFICMAAFINVMAQNNTKNVLKQYKSVMIDEGDTLWNIASKHNNKEISGVSIGDYIEDIKSINKLKKDEITAGNYIIIPVYIVAKE